MSLIEEIPRETDAEHLSVGGIMRGKEVLPAAAASVDMAHHDEEARVFEVHVGIYIDEWISANLLSARCILLHCKLA